MNLFGNVFICATKILISKNTFAVWHNWEISPKKIEWRQWYHVTCSKTSQCSSCCGKNFPGKSILKVWLLLVQKVSQLVYMNSSMSWIHLYRNSFIIVTFTKGESIGLHEFIYVMNSFIYEFIYTMNSYIQWIHVYHKFINSMSSSNRHVFRQANLCCINNQMWIPLFTCPKGNQWITAGHDKSSGLENLCCTLQQWFIRNRYGIEENPIFIQTLWGHGSTYIRGLII